MTTKYKLLLHIGFAKTATTTLQDNVLYTLHQEGKINYLGKSRKQTQNGLRITTIINRTFKNFKKTNSTHQIIEQLRNKIETQLSTDKLNVLSNEYISMFIYKYPAQIAAVFSNCDVHILCSLRSPVDRFYSSFIQNYWRLYNKNNTNTFAKFIQDTFNNRHSKKYGYARFFIEDYLSLIDQYFSHKTILLFEDLTKDQDSYFATLSNLLGSGGAIDAEDIKQKFLAQKLNNKQTNSIGKTSNPVLIKPFKRLYNFIITTRLFEYCLPMKKTWLKYPWILLSNLAKMLINITLRTEKAVTHPYPDKNQQRQIFAFLGIKNIDAFAKQHNLDKNKLIKYRY